MILTIQTDRTYTAQEFRDRKFNCEVILLCDFLTQFFKNVKLPPTQMIRVLVSNDKSIDEEISHSFKGNPVCTILYHYDIDDYFAQNEKDKVKEILSILENAVKQVALKMEFDPAIFNDGFELAKSLNGDFKYQLTKPKLKKGFPRTHIACYMLPSYRRFILQLEYPDGNNKEIEILRTNNYYVAIFDDTRLLITEGEWRDENTYVVYGKKGAYKRIIYTIDVLTEMVSIDFNLEPDIDAERYKREFEMATTMDEEMIDRYFSKKPLWHVYL